MMSRVREATEAREAREENIERAIKLTVTWFCVCGEDNPPGHYCCHCGASYEGERTEKEVKEISK